MEPTFDFGYALNLIKDGKKLARAGWNSKGMFVYLVAGRLVKHEDFRNEAAEAIKLAYRLEGNVNNTPSDRIVNSHIDMKAADGSIVVGWAPSQPDMMADDWMVVA